MGLFYSIGITALAGIFWGWFGGAPHRQTTPKKYRLELLSIAKKMCRNFLTYGCRLKILIREIWVSGAKTSLISILPLRKEGDLVWFFS
jgi:hypothetical protein